MIKSSYDEVKAYITKDGSIIRELMHPNVHGNRNSSLAEAIVKPGEKTYLHKHLTSEEIYHITKGRGVMRLGDERFGVKEGDTVLIPPQTPHCIENTGLEELKILCICSPAYSHEDTVVMEEDKRL